MLFFQPVFQAPQKSGKRKEPTPKLLGPYVLRWGGGFPREGVGTEKFGMSLEARETELFWRDVPGFCGDIPEVPEKFEKKMFVFNFRSLKNSRPKSSAFLSNFKILNPKHFQANFLLVGETKRFLLIFAFLRNCSLSEAQTFAENVGEGQKGTPGRRRERKCHDRASLSRPLVLSLGP